LLCEVIVIIVVANEINVIIMVIVLISIALWPHPLADATAPLLRLGSDRGIHRRRAPTAPTPLHHDRGISSMPLQQDRRVSQAAAEPQ
jgi:hypothetical protein